VNVGHTWATNGGIKRSLRATHGQNKPVTCAYVHAGKRYLIYRSSKLLMCPSGASLRPFPVSEAETEIMHDGEARIQDSASTDSHRRSLGTVGKYADRSAAAPGSGLSFGLIHLHPGPFTGDRGCLSALVRDARGRW
jgi:hypothetical protein